MKNKIRKEILTKLKTQPHTSRAAKSAEIKKRLFAEPAFMKARCVMLYVSTAEEVATGEMIEDAYGMGKTVCVPVVRRGSKEIMVSEIEKLSSLEEGPYGIYQPGEASVRPVPLTDIDVVIVPGIAFDAHSVRLGRGHGYYDRFLSTLPRRTKTIGLAYDFQVVEKLPRDSHDVPVSKIIAA